MHDANNCSTKFSYWSSHSDKFFIVNLQTSQTANPGLLALHKVFKSALLKEIVESTETVAGKTMYCWIGSWYLHSGAVLHLVSRNHHKTRTTIVHRWNTETLTHATFECVKQLFFSRTGNFVLITSNTAIFSAPSLACFNTEKELLLWFNLKKTQKIESALKA